MSRRWWLARGAIVVAAGLVLSLAYPPVAWAGLAWVALVPLFVISLRSSPGAAFGWAWLGGFVFFLALLRWLNFTFTTFSAIPWPLTWGPTALLAAYCALWVGAVGAGAAWIARQRGPGWAAWVLPWFWVAAEWGRGHFLGGFPWGLLAYSQYEILPVIQIAELGGVYAVSFVLASVNAAVVAAVLVPLRRAAVGLGAAALVVGGTLAFGSVRLAEPRPPGETRVAIVQPAIEQPLKWDERFADWVLEVYLTLTTSVPPGGADLIVWPETATPTVLRRDPVLIDRLATISGKLQMPLVVGSVDVEGVPPPQIRNSAFYVTEKGLERRYDKMHLVPFGEYVPFPELIGFVRGWAEFISDMEAGVDPVVFPGPPAPFGIVICYEGIFPELVREFVKRGARLMINMTNDGWFGRTSGPVQHLSMYPFRAVEHRTALVRAANTGVSAFIEPTGRIGRHLGLFERGVIIEALPLRQRQTFYTRLGNWFAWCAVAVSGAGLAAAAWRRA